MTRRKPRQPYRIPDWHKVTRRKRKQWQQKRKP